jgi:uncharacterized membrane protein YkoI
MHKFGRILALAGLGLTIASARADEAKIPLDKVPPAVLKAFKAKFPKNTIKAAIEEEEDGKTTYEIESTHDGLSVDAVLTPKGKFLAIEKELKTSDLPAAVAAAVKDKHPAGKVKKAEEVTEGDKHFYEVVVEEAGKTIEVSVDKNGKITD